MRILNIKNYNFTNVLYKVISLILVIISYPSEIKAAESPSCDDFMDKAMLVHVGRVCIDTTRQQAEVKGRKSLTYWTMNAVVPKR